MDFIPGFQNTVLHRLHIALKKQNKINKNATFKHFLTFPSRENASFKSFFKIGKG
jgi:hypothetical protein